MEKKKSYHTYIHTHIYIHTYMHTYIHTHTGEERERCIYSIETNGDQLQKTLSESQVWRKKGRGGKKKNQNLLM